MVGIEKIITKISQLNIENDLVVGIISSIGDAIDHFNPKLVLERIKDQLLLHKNQIFVCTGKNALAYANSILKYIPPTHIEQIWVFQTEGYYLKADLEVPKLIYQQTFFTNLTHPLPSLQNFNAVTNFLEEGISPTAKYHFFITGGTSSTFCLPEDGISNQIYIELNSKIFRSGAPIEDMNFCRQLLDRVKGGKLSYFIGSDRITSWIVSDVISDDPRIIGSGITTGPIPPTDYRVELFLSLCRKSLTEEFMRQLIETHWKNQQKPVSTNQLLVTRKELLASMVKNLELKHINSKILDPSLEGNFSELGNELSWFIDSDFSDGVFICAGEWTVNLPSKVIGKGGRLSHLITYLALLIQSKCTIIGIATDGKDGNTSSNFYLIDTPITPQQKHTARISLTEYNTHKFLELNAFIDHFLTDLNLMDLIIFIKY